MRHLRRADWMKADPSCHRRENVRQGSTVAKTHTSPSWIPSRSAHLAREVLLLDAFPEVLVRPPLPRRHLPRVVLEPIRLGQHEPLHIAAADLARLQKTGHGVATEKRQVAPEQDPGEAGEGALELVRMLRADLDHARTAH